MMPISTQQLVSCKFDFHLSLSSLLFACILKDLLRHLGFHISPCILMTFIVLGTFYPEIPNS